MDSTAHPRRHHIAQRSLLPLLAFCLSLLLAGCDFLGVSAPSANNSPTAVALTTVQPSPSLAPSLPDVSVFAAMQDGTITAFDAGNGSTRWQTNMGSGAFPSLLLVNQTLYVFSSTGVSSLRADDGSLLWHNQLASGELSSLAGRIPNLPGASATAHNTSYADGVLYLAGENVYALDATNGKQLWELQLTTDAVTVADGRVYLQSPYTSLSAVSAATGEPLWNSQTPIEARVVATESGLVYTIGSTIPPPSDTTPNPDPRNTTALTVLSASTGRARWHFPSQKAYVQWIGLANGTVYLLSDDGAPQPNGTPAPNILYALNASTGAVIWRTPIPNTVFADAQLVNGIIAAGTTTGAIEAFSASKGTPLWTQQPGQISTHIPTLVAQGGILYAQLKDLFALDLTTGAILWQAPLQDETLLPFALTNNILFLATVPLVNQGKENSIIALNNTDGSTRWQFSSTVLVPPPVLG